MSFGDWQPVIGLEIHAQLNTNSKIFSNDSTSFGSGDNENVSPVSLGMPGTLPVLNKAVVELAIKAGLALNCEINKNSIFARKNYFYPDLPKGYQISQFEKPICGEGEVSFYIDGSLRKVRIERAHLEEDAGKSTHHGNYSLINLNRAGVPLLEIVSAPEIFTAEEAMTYAKTVRGILRYIDVCDGNLEEGSLRCDCNISVRKKSETKLGEKVEIKNLNSFRFIEKALEYEINRQIDCLENGEEIIQETRLYDSAKNKTFTMRTKEDAHDYRYFPDPDILPVNFEETLIESTKRALPELPVEKAKRYQDQFGLTEDESFLLTQDKALAEYFEKAESICKEAKQVSNWMLTDIFRELNKEKTSIEEVNLTAESLAGLINVVKDGVISGSVAKKVFLDMWSSGKSAESIIEEKGLKQISDTSAINEIVEEVLSANQSQVDEYKSGKTKVFGFFVGQIMKKTKGQASPEVVTKILKEKLDA